MSGLELRDAMARALGFCSHRDVCCTSPDKTRASASIPDFRLGRLR